MNVKRAATWLYAYEPVRRWVNRVGPAYWRLPTAVRKRLCPESDIPKLPGGRTWVYGDAQVVSPRPRVFPRRPPTFGHRVAARRYSLPRPFVTELSDVRLVGRHATPVTAGGRVLLGGFRDQPRIMGLEPQDDLLEWLSRPAGHEPGDSRRLAVACTLINRLDPNYFHWITEWCGQVEGVEHYEQQTGRRPVYLVRGGGARFIRASLELLGVPPDRLIEPRTPAEAFTVDRLVVPSIPGNRVACSPRSLRWLRERFLRGAGVDPSSPADTKLYLPRPKGGWRCVLNDDDVQRALTERGFLVVRPEELSFADQVRLFSRARLIVGLHGSGLTNVLFAPHAAVLELVGRYGDGVFYSIAASLRQPYATFQCRAEGEDVTVDVDTLLQSIRDLEAAA